MGLKEYRAKRNFSRTPEPEGKEVSPPQAIPQEKPLIYVIQKHRASHLHYDLRLEEGGVLKSWAIPKEPPRTAGIKRLAVQTEDHPLGYEKFEGTIPEGEYGAGEVEIWDSGTYNALESKPTRKVVEIRGKKLWGRYALIRMKTKGGDDKNWLFFRLEEGGKETGEGEKGEKRRKRSTGAP